MKARSVNETTNFQRGLDPKDALDLGGIDRQRFRMKNLKEKLEKMGASPGIVAERFMDEPDDAFFDMSLRFIPYPDYAIKFERKDKSWVFEIDVANRKNWSSTTKFKSKSEKEILDYMENLLYKTFTTKINGENKKIIAANKSISHFELKIEMLNKYQNESKTS